MKKEIYQVCYECGMKHGTKPPKEGIGMWEGICDICGREDSMASAQHDYGIYMNKQQEIDDKFQDLI